MTDFVIGQKVAIYSQPGNYVHEATIERDTKLYWIADGRKFRKVDGQEPGNSMRWTFTTRLLPLDDERVIVTRAENRKRARFASIARAYDALRCDSENPERVHALRATLDLYAEVLT